MTFKEYHQNSLPEQVLAKNICNCEMICVCMAIDFLVEIVVAPAQGEHGGEGACLTVFL
ncbi:hypothetical protein [Janthinobacterium sp.]|uniref:hypothetical protein n=1 Tax=Janthinobacterium sp. TaxID=1871054 RepID=UPI0025C6D5B7|nr:hypothetical protein [Janthinobacterium sp.]